MGRRRVAQAEVTETSKPVEKVVKGETSYEEITKNLDRWIADEVELKNLPALSIALVDDQRIVWAKGFGFADPEARVPATADTPYRVGSISKLFTDLAVMQLVEQGKLDLDAPVTAILPDFAPKNPFNEPVTLRHLMSHRSGLVREPPVGHYFDPTSPFDRRGRSEPQFDVAGLQAWQPHQVFERGSRGRRHGSGEGRRSSPSPGSLRRTIFEPLGMTRSSFEPDPELARQMAQGTMWSYDGRTIATPTFLSASAGREPRVDGQRPGPFPELRCLLRGEDRQARDLTIDAHAAVFQAGRVARFRAGVRRCENRRGADDRPRRGDLWVRVGIGRHARRQTGCRRDRITRLRQRHHPADRGHRTPDDGRRPRWKAVAEDRAVNAGLVRTGPTARRAIQAE